MDHKEFLGTLSTQDKLTLQTRSTMRGLTHLLGHIAAILMGAVCVAQGWPLWWVILVAHGICLTFLFTLEHECTHKTPFGHGWLNEWVGHACGLVLVLPFTWFRYFHLAHHRWTNIPGKDPELDSPKPETRAEFAWHISGIPYWYSAIRLLVQDAIGTPPASYIPSTAHARIKWEARLMIAVYAVALLFIPNLLWLWVIPMLVGQPFLRLYLLAEHGRCPQVVNMFENTRTVFTTAIVRFLAWNMPYHAEHHIFPSVPFYQLPKLHRFTQDHLAETSDGYAKFTRQYTQDLRK